MSRARQRYRRSSSPLPVLLWVAVGAALPVCWIATRSDEKAQKVVARPPLAAATPANHAQPDVPESSDDEPPPASAPLPAPSPADIPDERYVTPVDERQAPEPIEDPEHDEPRSERRGRKFQRRTTRPALAQRRDDMAAAWEERFAAWDYRVAISRQSDVQKLVDAGGLIRKCVVAKLDELDVVIARKGQGAQAVLDRLDELEREWNKLTGP
jgi:hypothetical protein